MVLLGLWNGQTKSFSSLAIRLSSLCGEDRRRKLFCELVTLLATERIYVEQKMVNSRHLVAFDLR